MNCVFFFFPGQSRLSHDCRNAGVVITTVLGNDEFGNPILLPTQPNPTQSDASLMDLFDRPLSMDIVHILSHSAQIMEQTEVNQDLTIRLRKSITRIVNIDER